ncbi:hypothetical protein D3C85_1195040 [compost metagenome]
MRRVQDLAPELHGQRWRHAGSRSHQRGLDGFVDVQLFLGIMGQGMGQRAEETVGGENTEEGTDQCRTDVQADGLLVALTQRGHGHHDTQYRRDDTETGHGVGDAVHRVGRMLQVFLEAEQFHVEQAFQLVRRHVAGRHDAQVIADERGHALVLEYRRVLREDRTRSGIFDVAFDGHHAFAAALVEDLVDQAQHFKVEGVVET